MRNVTKVYLIALFAVLVVACSGPESKALVNDTLDALGNVVDKTSANPTPITAILAIIAGVATVATKHGRRLAKKGAMGTKNVTLATAAKVAKVLLPKKK